MFYHLEISHFYKFVSSEFNFDFLKFKINGTKVGEWSGEDTVWSFASFPVTNMELIHLNGNMIKMPHGVMDMIVLGLIILSFLLYI